MRLDFNILWVEDQPDAVTAQKERIDFLLRKEGFKINAEFAVSVTKAEAFLGNGVFGDHVDLILMDYDLGDGPNGSVGIDKVRDKLPYKDIIFYSASGVQKLQDSIQTGKAQGIFWADRRDLPDTVLGVFKSLVKKVLDIEHSRGIVMGATSEIDHFVNMSLETVFLQGDQEFQISAFKFVATQLMENKKTFEKELKKAEAVVEMASLIKLHQVYTSSHRLNLLRKMLELRGTHAPERNEMCAYATTTIPQRNDLAHIRVVRDGFSRKLYDRAGKEITVDDMRALRVAMLKYHELFEQVSGSLQSKNQE